MSVSETLPPRREGGMAEQVPFSFGSDVDLASNPEPRCPCVLLMDTSASMAGAPMAALNEGLQAYRSELLGDSLAAQRVEVALVTFGGAARLAVPFTPADQFDPPTLVADGDTPLGAAIRLGLDCIRERKQQYKAHGLAYFRPWVFLMTDGAPTDEWESAARIVREGEASRAFAFFSVGVEGANFSVLKEIGTREPLRLRGLCFREMFVWLSQSQRGVSRSKPGQEDGVRLENPAGPRGWASLS